MKIKRWGETVNTGVKPRASDLLCELSAMAAPYRALHTNECLRSSHRKCSEVCTLACQIGEAGLEDSNSLPRIGVGLSASEHRNSQRSLSFIERLLACPLVQEATIQLRP
jgi:hypothetical protein